jgi:hypothetical protein
MLAASLMPAGFLVTAVVGKAATFWVSAPFGESAVIMLAASFWIPAPPVRAIGKARWAARWLEIGVPRPRARLQRLDHPGQIVERQPESACAATGLPDAENGDPAVRVPAEPHAPGISPDVEEDLSLSWQRNGIRLGHAAYRRPARAGCPANELHWPANVSYQRQPLRQLMLVGARESAGPDSSGLAEGS